MSYRVGAYNIQSCVSMIMLDTVLFRCVLASLYEGLSVPPLVGWSVGPSSVRPSVTHSLNLLKFDILPISTDRK